MWEMNRRPRLNELTKNLKNQIPEQIEPSENNYLVLIPIQTISLR